MVKSHNNSLTKQTAVRMGAIALGMAALLLPGCNNPQEIAEEETNVTTEDVAEDPVEADDANASGLVTVRGEVSQELDEQGFELQSEGESILVINASGTPLTLPTDDVPVQVTGDSVQFVTADVESEYGLELDPELYVDYEEQPAIIAESIALAPTAEQLAEDPSPYYDQVIALQGEARRVYSPSALSVFEDGWVDDVGLMVVGVDQVLQTEGEGGEVQQGEMVVVTGRVEPFDLAQLEQEYELGLEPDVVEEFEASYTEEPFPNRPVIVADDIYPSAVEE
ncbi:MAG: hypothetical protein ACFB4I_13095 [Cyanophyceae cyanobacterium]